MNLIPKIFKKHKLEGVLMLINENRGILWERIAEFTDAISRVDGAVMHHTDAMQERCPIKHTIKDGLYTREIFMPKGELVVSFIHKKNHPSFFMKGEMTIMNDTGELQRIKAPMVVQTEVGTQRVAVMHEDCIWVDVYRTDEKNVEEAENDVYTQNYLELPQHIILNKKLLCQD